MPRADVHRCKCSGTRLLSAGWHSSTEKQSRQFTLNTAGVHWSLVAEHLAKDGGAQGCCQLAWHSSTEKQGMQFTLNTAGVHWCLMAEHLYAKSGCS